MYLKTHYMNVKISYPKIGINDIITVSTIQSLLEVKHGISNIVGFSNVDIDIM